MNRFWTFAFLLACLLAGVGLALVIRYRKAPPEPVPTAFEIKAGAALPEVRGVTLASHAGMGVVESLKKAREMGANYVALDAAVIGDDAGKAADIGALVAAAHALDVKVCVMIHVGPRTDMKSWAQAGHKAGVDLLALKPASSEGGGGAAEANEAFWKPLLQTVRKEYHGAVAYVAGPDDYPFVTWWEQVDYVGVAGPFALSTVAHPTPYQLQAGMNTQIGSVQTFCRPIKKTAILFEVSYPPTGEAAVHPEASATRPGAADGGLAPLQKLCYEAALVGTKGQPYLGGLFLGARPDPLSSKELGETIHRQWVPASTQAAAGRGPATRK